MLFLSAFLVFMIRYATVDFGTLERRRRQAERDRLGTPPDTPREMNEAEGQSQGIPTPLHLPMTSDNSSAKFYAMFNKEKTRRG